MIIKNKDANKKKIGSMKIAEYKINSNFSGALISIDGNHGKVKCLNEDRIYFIVEGGGKFIIDDEEKVVEVNDVIFVPKETPYNMIGRMKYFLVCSPEFNPKDDIKIVE